MKKLLFSLLTILFVQTVLAQDMKKVRSAYEKKDWAKAKDALDLYLAGDKGKADWEGWYYKGLIYSQVGKDAALKTNYPDAWQQSFEGYQKAVELDSKQVGAFMMMRNYPVFENYQYVFNLGIELFKAEKAKEAYDKFVEADQVGRFIFKNGWALSEVDTLLYYYTGVAAMQAEMKEEAVRYYQKIADKEIGGDGYDICYRYLAYHFDKKGDKELTNKYVTAGRKLYPNDSYYDKLELDRERKNGVGTELFKKYEVVLQKETEDYDLRYDYAAELFNWLYIDRLAPDSEKEKTAVKILDQLNTCIKLNSSKPDAYLLTGKTYFNEAAALQDSYNQIKGKTPADQEKKSTIKSAMESKMRQSLAPFEKAEGLFEKMPADEFKKDRRNKSEYKTTLYLLAEAHKFLGDTKKAEAYEKKEQAVQ